MILVQKRHGMTLIELLIVIAILLLLMQLAIPAINASLEAARRNQCSNNLHEISLGVVAHLEIHGRFPSGGWDSRWVGDPSRGSGREQPGGWIFNLLPYLEKQTLWEEASSNELRAALQATPIPLFTCRSRRSGGPYPNVRKLPIKNSDLATMHARSDYAANGGDFPWTASVDIDSYDKFAEGSFNYPFGNPDLLSGICFRGSEIRPKDVTDGLSMCYLIGEKSMYYGHYKSGVHPGDDQSMFIGEDLDTTRWSREFAEDHPNLPQWDDRVNPDVRNYAFGSAHLSGFNMAFCDGSVKHVSYNIDPSVHQALGNRHDGMVVGLGSLEQ